MINNNIIEIHTNINPIIDKNKPNNPFMIALPQLDSISPKGVMIHDDVVKYIKNIPVMSITNNIKITYLLIMNFSNIIFLFILAPPT